MSNAASLVLTHEAAQKAAAECASAAAAKGVAASIAVVDAGGHPVAFVRMTGASFHSKGIAEDKAYTSVSFGASTGALARAYCALPEHVREELRRRPQLVLLKGGVLLPVGGKIIGAIGVSGASEDMDEEIAMAGVAAIANFQ
jgi:uncharacterized protein GlcG (DUF336 family)